MLRALPFAGNYCISFLPESWIRHTGPPAIQFWAFHQTLQKDMLPICFLVALEAHFDSRGSKLRPGSSLRSAGRKGRAAEENMGPHRPKAGRGSRWQRALWQPRLRTCLTWIGSQEAVMNGTTHTPQQKCRVLDLLQQPEEGEPPHRHWSCCL